jgi:hypothetical protein
MNSKYSILEKIDEIKKKAFEKYAKEVESKRDAAEHAKLGKHREEVNSLVLYEF